MMLAVWLFASLLLATACPFAIAQNYDPPTADAVSILNTTVENQDILHTQVTVLTADGHTIVHNVSEQQPADFVVQPRFKRSGIDIYSIKLLIVLVDSIGLLARQSFNATFSRWEWPGTDRVSVHMTSSKSLTSAGFQTKTMMWSLRSLVQFFEIQHRYAEVSFISGYANQPSLGGGHLTYTPPGPQNISSSTDVSDDSTANDDFITADDFKNIAMEPVYKPADLLELIMSLLIDVAEQGPDVLLGAISVYNNRADLSLIVGATSRPADPMPYKSLVIALLDLASKLPLLDPTYQWRQTHFLIRNNRVIVGKGVFVKGGPPGLESFLKEADVTAAPVSKF
ncbi:uncharacterized protein KY384_005107 [Bacidia gigantensis]|uniref:uncharacterized protein n=1 Tax=Bacidia gigantensis TaxID=2732470 RepID=UPI001D0581B2|nr:uncharacterized protein KY384_005107 [Bacidia gigantensis]KAG8529627.1 hypothetical protein KY384_005107 [Bacidia gigantensis]